MQSAEISEAAEIGQVEIVDLAQADGVPIGTGRRPKMVLAIVLGLFTRPVAFVLAGEMAVAYFQFHAPQSFFPTVNQGIPAILYCFLFLYLMVAGAGAWSIDAMIAARRSRV